MTLTEKQAEAELRRQSNESLTTEKKLSGDWVPQVSSKCKGITVDVLPDWQADGEDDIDSVKSMEILAFHLALRQRWDAITVWPTSLGLTSDKAGGRCDNGVIWMSIVPVAFSGPEAANRWCDEQGFPTKECYARRVNGKGGGTQHVERQ